MMIRSHFQKLLRKYMSRVQLLTETDLPIQVIAEQIGYEDPLNFSKAFKKVYEQSPTAYRKKVQEQIEDEKRITGEGEVTANGK